MTCGPHVIKRLRDYFTKYPKSSPRAACAALRLDPKGYAATARVVKCRVRGEIANVSAAASTANGDVMSVISVCVSCRWGGRGFGGNRDVRYRLSLLSYPELTKAPTETLARPSRSEEGPPLRIGMDENLDLPTFSFLNRRSLRTITVDVKQ
jgi:hypothetical protein